MRSPAYKLIYLGLLSRHMGSNLGVDLRMRSRAFSLMMNIVSFYSSSFCESLLLARHDFLSSERSFLPFLPASVLIRLPP